MSDLFSNAGLEEGAPRPLADRLRPQKINEVEIDRKRFPEKLLFQIKQHYVKSPFFSDYFYEFEDLLLNHQ